MKRKLSALILGMSVVFAGAPQQQQHHDMRAPQVSAVVVKNPAFSPFAAKSLREAEQRAHAMAFLDPLCGVIQGMCEARFRGTTYIVIYVDGTVETIN